jgi:hypothetical protein
MSTTDRGRSAFVALFCVVTLAAVVGWFLDKDPGQLAGVLLWVSAAIGLGEASNIGKRATWKSEAVEAERAS